MRQLALIEFLLPLAMTLWLALGRAPSRRDLALRLAGAWLLLIGLWRAGLWLALPTTVTGGLAVAMALASVPAIQRIGSATGGSRRVVLLWLGRSVALGSALFGAWLLVPALIGERVPAGAVDLAFPFRSGRYLIANGGATERVNAHLMTLQPGFARWRGESYGTDLIKVDDYGFRTRERRLLNVPEDPAAYLAFGEPVYAPCAGAVEEAVGGLPDMPVPMRDRSHLEGNFVRLRCGTVVVLLGHLRRGSVKVGPGDHVQTGQLLGAVGNSGNSDEPHLHIHAQMPGTAEAPLSGQPLLATFNGRFLVRNMSVSAQDVQSPLP
jgi:hypothetical protein